ncbi:MAG: Ig-like domain-containing protein, partial [Betaproteobacteria bacterium]
MPTASLQGYDGFGLPNRAAILRLNWRMAREKFSMVVAIRWLFVVFAGLLATIAHAQTTVQSVAPADGAMGVSLSTSIVVTFSASMDGASLTTQTADGACTQTLQVSSDGFVNCIGFSSALASTVGAVATLTPAAALARGSTYRVRVLAAARSVAMINLAADFTGNTTLERR